jgi:hypothetical protein
MADLHCFNDVEWCVRKRDGGPKRTGWTMILNDFESVLEELHMVTAAFQNGASECVPGARITQ